MRALCQLLLLGVSVLAAGACETARAQSGGGLDAVVHGECSTPDEPDQPDQPDEPDPPDEPDAPDAPDELAEPDASDVPEPEQSGAGGDADAASDNSGSSGSGSEGGGADDNGGSSGSGSDGGGRDDRSGESSGPGSGGAGGRDNGSGSNSGSSNGSGSDSSGTSRSNSSASNSSGHRGGAPDAPDVVQRHLSGPIEIASDEMGREHLVGEALMLGASVDVSHAAEAGYRLISEARLGSADRVVARLLVPPTLTVGQAVGDLRALAPRAIVGVNTAYRSTQSARHTRAAAPLARRPLGNAVLGIIDTGADPHVGAVGGFIATRGFGPAGYRPREHGSAVASIALAQGLRVRVADVFGSTSNGEAVASASAIAAALQWMLDEGVVVINISVEGPHNPVVESLINEAARSGHVIVAAAGNGGPLADPAFPGAYEGALAVTAVDGAGRAYLRANRGDYIDFAALGVDVSVEAGDGLATVSGTSFAAPLVAAMIAEEMPRASPADAARVINRLRQRAIDRGRAGRDSIYGWGEVRAN